MGVNIELIEIQHTEARGGSMPSKVPRCISKEGLPIYETIASVCVLEEELFRLYRSNDYLK